MLQLLRKHANIVDISCEKVYNELTNIFAEKRGKNTMATSFFKKLLAAVSAAAVVLVPDRKSVV